MTQTKSGSSKINRTGIAPDRICPAGIRKNVKTPMFEERA
jgi:hypothetical protein